MTTWELEVSHDITESGIAPMSIQDMLDLVVPDKAASITENALREPQRYSEARGTARLRHTIAETYAELSADDVLVTTGAIEANFLVFNTILNEGDHVVVTTPCYQQLVSVPRALGCEVSEWPVTSDGGFSFDLDLLDQLVTDSTRMIVINSPHNPTGALLTQHDLVRIAEIASRSNAWVLSDEAYRWISHPGGVDLATPFRDVWHRGISIGSMSKCFGLPGLRLGWIAASAELAHKCWSLRDYTTLSPTILSDTFSQIAIEHVDTIRTRNDGIIKANLATARAWFEHNSDIVAWQEPAAGLLAMIDVLGCDCTDELATTLARDASVMLAPGSAFGLPGHLRVGIGQHPHIFAEALDRTATSIRQFVSDPGSGIN
jgi:aspartate/methionine/tyrosine aminotransferase